MRQQAHRASDAKKFTVMVGPEAVNFNQVHVGDRVDATVTQKVIVSLDDKETSSNEGAAAVVIQAPTGDQLGGLAAETFQLSGTVIANDLEKRTVTLRFEGGTTEIFPVRADVNLSRHKVGEQLLFRVTEMIVIWVEKPQQAAAHRSPGYLPLAPHHPCET